MSILSKLIKRGQTAPVGSQTLTFPAVNKDRVRENDRYAEWVRNHKYTPQMKAWCEKQMAQFSSRPQIGILMQCQNPREPFLRESLATAFNQIYPFVEFAIVDRGSADPQVRKLLSEVEVDARVKVSYQKGTERDVTAIAKIMKTRSAEWLLLMGAEDVLEPYTLFNMAAALQNTHEVDFVFSDSDLLDDEGYRIEPQFKPQWALGAHYPYGYYQHPVLLHNRVAVKMQGFERVSLYMEKGELLDEASNHSKQAIQAAGILYHGRKHGLKNEVPPPATASVLMNENLIEEKGHVVIDTEVRAMTEPLVPLRILWLLDSLDRDEKAEVLLAIVRYLVKKSAHQFTIVALKDGTIRKDYEATGAAVRIEPPASLAQRIREWHSSEPFDVALMSLSRNDAPIQELANLKLPAIWQIDSRSRESELEPLKADAHPATVLFPTFESAEPFRKDDSHKVIRVLPSGVDMDTIKLYKQQTSPILLRDEMKVGKQSTVITVVDPFVESKNQHVFIEAAIQLQKRDPDRVFDFYLVGQRPGPYAQKLQKLIETSIHPENFHVIPEGEGRAQYYPYFWISNICVSCSALEIYPQSILEAMSFKKPVVATNVSAFTEIIEDHENGYLVPVGDAGALAEKLELLTKDVPLQEGCGRRSFEIILEKYHLKKTATRMENLLRESIVAP